MRTVIGGIIGAVAGFVVGGPMGAVVGAGIGAGIGAMATPTKIQGAKVGEEEVASVASGTPIGIILGEGGIKGDLLWQGPRKVVKVKEEQEGKGGGTTVENEEVQRDYGIHFCESNERRGTKIKSVKIIRRNKIIVYDTRPGSKLSGADNAKFMENVTFYFGDADQVADPTYEAHFGHLGAPAYRNQFTMVVRNHLLGKFGNAIPTYEVITCGGPYEDEEGEDAGNFLLVTGQAKIGDTSVWAAAQATAIPSFVGLDIGTGADLALGLPEYHNGVWVVANTDAARMSTNNRETWQPIPLDSNTQPITGIVGGDNGWFVKAGDEFYPEMAHSIQHPPSSFINSSPVAVATNGVNTWQVDNSAHIFKAGDFYFASFDRCLFRAETPSGPWITLHDQFSIIEAGLNPNGACNFNYRDAVKVDGKTYFTMSHEFGLAERRARVIWSPDDGVTIPDSNIVHDVLVAVAPGVSQMVVAGGEVVGYCGDVLVTSADGFGAQHATGLTSDASPGRKIAAVGSRVYVIGAGIASGDKCVVFDPSSLTFGSPITMPIKGAVGIAASSGPTYLLPSLTNDDVELPDVGGHYVDKYDGGYSGRDSTVTIPPPEDCSMSLASVIRTLSKRTQVPPEILDVTRVEHIRVRGVSFRATSPVRTAIDTFAELYQLDVADSGGGISIVPRGGPIDLVIEDGDILLSSKEVVKKKRGQQSEFPKIATLRYVDPTQDFEESSQRSVIKTKDFRATGEKTFTVSVTMSPDEAATQITRIHAEMQDQLEGSIQFDLPLKYLAVIPSTVASYLGKRYRVTKRRVEPWKIIIDSAIYDRASTYSLTAEGTVTGHTPTPQSSLVGPTMFAPMNMPVAIDTYDRPCLHAVVQGILPGWRGADIYIKRGTGPYELTVSNMPAGVMGELTDSITALSARGIDHGQTLKFKLYADSEAESITFEQLLEERNPFALLKPDYTVNIGQFMEATETDPQTYEATGLAWNGLDTSPASFAAGTVIAFLNNVQMIPLRTSDLGQTIKVKAVSRGTAVEAAPEHTITLATMESLREWQPYYVQETWSETGVCLSWIGRGRLGTSRSPLHSQYFEGYTVRLVVGDVSFEVDTTEQELCISAATLASKFGLDYPHPTITVRARSRVPADDGSGGGGHDSPPAPGPTSPPAVGGSGGPASTTTGPNGGFPDNAPPLYPLPTTFDVPTMPDPGFDNPNTILRWRKQDGSPLGPEWFEEDGKLKFQGGRGIHRAYDYGTRFGMAAQPFPRLSIQTDADVQNSVGTKSRIGVAWGLWTVAYMPSYIEASGVDGVGLSYLDETPVSHTWLHEIMRTGGGVNVPGQYAHLNFMPVIEHVVEYGFNAGSATVDNFDMQVSLIDPPVTAETPYNLDLANGMDGISLYPDPADTNPFVPDVSVVGGVMIVDFHHAEGNFRWAIWDDPFVNADEVDKFIKLNWEGWSDSTTVRTNNTGKFYPVGGVCAGLCFRSPDGMQQTVSLAGLVERGDFTPREGYHHVPIDTVATGYTVHAAMLFVGFPGDQAKMRNYTAASTNATYPETP